MRRLMRTGAGILGLMAATVTLGPLPRASEAGQVQAPKRPLPYHAVHLGEDGGIDEQGLSDLVSSVRSELGSVPNSGSSQVVILVHGFNTSLRLGRTQYREIARSLRAQAAEEGAFPIIVGVHWASYPGAPAQWFPQMIGYRFLAAAGFPNAVGNPYLQKVEVAVITGRTGFRTLLERLAREFPERAVNVLAHSMGCEVVARALAEPAASDLQLVVLAGADLDRDAFAAHNPKGVEAALPRAQVWWITVPRRNTADGALELRRAAGRRDAMGNRGLELDREQFDALMRRGGLVIDNGSVPITHDITDYYTDERLEVLQTAMSYLQARSSGQAQAGTSVSARHGGLLGALDRILKADPARLPDPGRARGASGKLYLRWKQEPTRTDYGTVKLWNTQ
jgi:pimeloyl-ACP methyl ester carboxylesterase